MNHRFLADLDVKHATCYKVYGVFTSSSKRIDDIIPELINQPPVYRQIHATVFLRYPKPKLIEKSFVAFDDLVDLRAPHLKEYLASLEDKNQA